MIRFIYFDASGTLVRPHPSVGAVYAAACRPHGLTASPGRLDREFRRRWEERRRRGDNKFLSTGLDDVATRSWWRGLVWEVLEAVDYRGDREACFAACYDAFAGPDAWRVFPDVKPTLEALGRRGFGMGVLSNWDYRLPRLLAALGLASFFGPVLVSALEGLQKPDTRFFALACRRAGHDPEEIAHVGDEPVLDLEPARASGMRGFLIDRSRPADAERLGDLRELLQHLPRDTQETSS